MRLAKSLSVYAFAMLFNAALSFATFSLLTHHLTEVDFGIINLYNSFTIFIVPFIGVGIQFTLSVDYFKMDEASYRTHFSNAVLIPITSCLILTVLCLIFFYPLQQLIKVNFFFALTLPFSGLLIVLNDVMLSLIRNKGKHILYAGFSIARNVVEISLTILFVVGLGMAWRGRLASALMALIASGFVVYYLVRKWRLYNGNYNKDEIKKVIITGLPFIPERLAIFVLAYSDRFFIDFYRGIGDVGYYGAGAQIGIIVNLCTLTLISTFHPYIFKNLSTLDFKSVRKATLSFIGISLFVTASVIIGTPYLFKFFIGKNFQPGQVYAKLIAIGYFFWAIYAVFMAYLLYLKKNRGLMTISILGMILSLSLNFINVKKFGAIGATYTSILVYFFMAAAAVYTVHKFIGLKKIFLRA